MEVKMLEEKLKHWDKTRSVSEAVDICEYLLKLYDTLGGEDEEESA